MIADKRSDLAGPGIGNYEELEKVLPQDYVPLLSPKDTQKAIFVPLAFEFEICQYICNLHLIPRGSCGNPPGDWV